MKKIYTTLYRLKMCKKYLPIIVRRTLVSSNLINHLINPIIDYTCLVYNDLISEQNIKLQRSYNSCIRIIFDARKDVHTLFYIRLKSLKVKNKRYIGEYFLRTFMYRLLKTKRHKYLLILCIDLRLKQGCM